MQHVVNSSPLPRELENAYDEQQQRNEAQARVLDPNEVRQAGGGREQSAYEKLYDFAVAENAFHVRRHSRAVVNRVVLVVEKRALARRAYRDYSRHFAYYAADVLQQGGRPFADNGAG